MPKGPQDQKRPADVIGNCNFLLWPQSTGHPDDVLRAHVEGIKLEGFVHSDRWSKLTDAERVALCRRAALEAQASAASANPDLHKLYKNIAAQWDELASEIEARQSPLGRTA